MKAVVGAFHQEKALVEAFSVIANPRVDQLYWQQHQSGARLGIAWLILLYNRPDRTTQN